MGIYNYSKAGSISVYITQLTLNNVKCFRKLDLDFARPDGNYAGWTVFAGRNGAGKSSLLQILAATLAGFGEKLIDPESFLRKDEGGWESTVCITQGVKDISDNNPKICRLKWTNGGAYQEDDRDIQGVDYLPNPGWFLAGYGPYRRISGHTSDALELMARDPWSSRTLTLFRPGASLVETVTWLKDVDHRSVRGAETQQYSEIKNDVIQLLNHGLLPEGAEVSDVGTEGLVVQLNGAPHTLHQLSDGYRAVTALVVDLLRNMYARFGTLSLTQEKGYPTIEHDGVVLIDEVETHLHISWQREIGFWLKKHFPNIQFLVSTHSPFVCQAADSGGIIHLPSPNSNQPVNHISESLLQTIINGSSDHAATSELFGLPYAHSDEAQLIYKQVADLEVSLLHGNLTPEDRRDKRKQFKRLTQLLPEEYR